jgi:antiviral helicase SLH1
VVQQAAPSLMSNGLASIAANAHPPLSATSKPYIPGSSMVIQTQQDLLQAKQKRAEQRKYERAKAGKSHEQGDGSNLQYTAEEMAMLRAQSLQAATNRPLFTSDRSASSEPVYPHVYSAQGGGGSVLSAFGAKFSLPVGTTRIEHEFFEEVTIPPPKQLPFRHQERLVPITEMDSLSRGAFPGYASLNRLQSAVYPLGYGSNENLLVCAPTGAGKTDVAMLTVLRTIKMHARSLDPTLGETSNGRTGNLFGIRYDDFKIIYVAPMKALASEIVAKFSKRLRYLGVKVRELTGDMQLTRQEIAETQMIVTTPEKWDVVTRKPSGEGELATKVRLLIIDEVHLLHEDRGAVIETIVARTLRLVESSQSLIRIVGLSATLPNYVDVADFLRVNRYQGLFFFDSSFRPVPLEQHFIGVQGKPGSPQSRLNHDKATYEKLSTLIEQGHQVMIFVHARKETVKTATTMREMCKEEGILELIQQARDDGSMAGKVNTFRREVMESRNRELKELFETGFGIHHAGMLRKDRNLSERMFETGVTRVLCCTSTLAWGVNLPAYAVLIKGTDVYDSSLGRFSDLSILDVLQIFGRAGRPQYESVGVGYIITPMDKLSHYVDAITSQHPIESKFKTGIIDALNAEVALGSVSNVADGTTWLSYTYLFTRMKRNPLAYGMLADEVVEDPQLGARRLIEITAAAKYLASCKMLQFDAATGQFTMTELGRIAAKYYITYKTIEIFNVRLKSQMSEADILAVFAQGTDFEQIIPRENEVQELKSLESKVPCQIIGAHETSPGKTNLLLQAYISRLYIDDFALVSDTGYIAQNAGRVMRALLEIALSNKWAVTSAALLGMTRAVERRLWPFDHPLDVNQSGLKPDLVYQLKRWAEDVEIKELANMDKDELATLCKVNARHAEVIRDAARHFPMLTTDYKLKPITHDLIAIQVTLTKDFEWKDSRTTPIEPFYIWIESEDGSEILQWKRIIFRPQTTELDVSFLVDALSTSSNGLWIRWASDKWLGSDDLIHVAFDHLIMPPVPKASTKLLDLPLLSTDQSLQVLSAAAKTYYTQQVRTLNSLQTQAFHSIVHTQGNVLFCAPSRSGKTTMAHLAIWKCLQRAKGSLVLALYPNISLAFQAHNAFRRSASKDFAVATRLWKTGVEIPSQDTAGSTVIFAAPSTALLECLADQPMWLRKLHMVVLEDLHLMSAIYEMTTCQLQRMTTSSTVQYLATASSLLHTTGLQEWLQVKDSKLYNFQAVDRPCPFKTSLITFDMPHSLNLLKVMIKPAYDRIKGSGAKTKAVIFVPSRGQCYTTAKDLITQSASELETEAFLGMHPSEMEPYLLELSDRTLREPLQSGIGIIHEGIKSHDRALILSLYDSGAINLLVVGRDSIWSLEVRCNIVIMMSIQFFRSDNVKMQDVLIEARSDQSSKGKPKLSNAKLVDYPVTDIIRMQSFAAEASVSLNEAKGGECLIMCQQDQVSFVRRMLDEGYVLESTSLEEGKERLVIVWLVLVELSRGRIDRVDDVVQLLNWTLARRQMNYNPSYYGARSGSDQDASERLSQIADDIVNQLLAIRCVEKADQESSLTLTSLGRVVLSSQTLLFSLSTMIDQYIISPDKTAQSVIEALGKSKSKVIDIRIDDEAVMSVLVATRESLPRKTLTQFGVSKAAKKVKQEEGQAVESEESPLTSSQAKSLLLAVFVTPGADIRTTQDQSKAKTPKPKPANESIVDGRSLHSQTEAKIQLREFMFELVQKLLVK